MSEGGLDIDGISTGINYLVGDRHRVIDQLVPVDRTEIGKEMRIIHDDLNCDSVRIAGAKTERAIVSAKIAMENGLLPWMSPRFNYANFEQTKKELSIYCKKAINYGLEEGPLIVANELVFDCEDATGTILKTGLERHETIHKMIQSGERPDMTDKVIELMKIARAAGWKGTLSYAAFAYENVDWQKVKGQGLGNIEAGINLYWERDLSTNEARPAEHYERNIQAAIQNASGLKLNIFEFGTVPHGQGLAWGGGGFKLEGDPDYDAQKNALLEYLGVLKNHTDVGLFLYTFNERKKNQAGSYGIVGGDNKDRYEILPAGKEFGEFAKSRINDGAVIDIGT
ncbi:MAG: hypothetical protein WA152_01450 [Microgenomates group bacterium]